jgi:hypothetical protein
VTLAMDLLTPAYRYPIPEVRIETPLDLSDVRIGGPVASHALRTGEGMAAMVASNSFDLPDGPMTLEAWFKADGYGRRTGLVAKTEGSDYGIFVSEGRPEFSVHLGGAYRSVEASSPVLKTGVWHHVAGVYDGSEVRMYLDGELLDTRPASGSRRTNDLPLMIGSDVDRGGNGTSFFEGEIDAVRVSKIARYSGSSFTPERSLANDGDAVLLTNLDARVGPYLFDEVSGDARVRMLGGATLVPTAD